MHGLILRSITVYFMSDPSGLRECHCPDVCNSTTYEASIGLGSMLSNYYLEKYNPPNLAREEWKERVQ